VPTVSQKTRPAQICGAGFSRIESRRSARRRIAFAVQIVHEKSNQPHCFWTLNHIVGICYKDARVIKWLSIRKSLICFID